MDDGNGEIERFEVGSGAGARTIARVRRAGGGPGLLWLGGFRSDMTGTKAVAVDALGARRGLAVTRFDYSGHGRSGGRFEDGTISRWLEEATAVFEATAGDQIVIGSSMGGWLSLLLARAHLARVGRAASRIRALVLIAPAADFTEELIWVDLPPAVQREIVETGGHRVTTAEFGEPYTLTRALFEDGRRHMLLGGDIEVGCPVTILQGMADESVPWRHAIRIVTRLTRDDVTLSLIQGGDHRLSRDEDLARLTKAIEDALGSLTA